MRHLWPLLLGLSLLASPTHADVQCDGVDDRLTSPLAVSQFVTASAYTLMGWIKSTGSTFAEGICWGDGPLLMDESAYVVLGRGGIVGGSGVCALQYAGGNFKVTASLTAGWHHIASRYSGGTLELFVDGVSVGTTSVGNIEDTTYSLSLCGSALLGPFASPDRVTDVQTYTVALSNAAIEVIGRSRTRGVGRTMPSAAWSLTECADGAAGQGISFRDRTGNNRTLTGNAGGNTTGLTCRASEHLSRPMPIQ